MSDNLRAGRELDEACARALGWEGAINGRPVWFIPNHARAFLLPPPFSSDIGYARLLEDEIERLGSLYAKRYVEALAEVLAFTAKDMTEHDASCLWLLLRATPEQRARAFLEAIFRCLT